MPVWFLLCTSGFAFFSALKITLSVRTTVRIWCAKMALQQYASISLGGDGTGGTRRVGGNCLFAGHFFVFLPILGNLVLNFSDSSPTLW